MQIVINISEEMYENALNDRLCGSETLVNAIKNGIPHETVTEFADRCRECGREKVLDKIKAEIEQFADAYCSGDDINIYDVFQIIDKYNAEGKG